MERHIKQQHPEHWSSKPRGGRRNHSATVPVLAPQFRSAVAAVAAAAAAAGSAAQQQTSLQPDGGLTNGGGGLVTVVNPNNNNNEAYHSRQSRVSVSDTKKIISVQICQNTLSLHLVKQRCEPF